MPSRPDSFSDLPDLTFSSSSYTASHLGADIFRQVPAAPTETYYSPNDPSLLTHTYPGNTDDFNQSLQYQHAYSSSPNFGAPPTLFEDNQDIFHNADSLDFEWAGFNVQPDQLQAISPRRTAEGPAGILSDVTKLQRLPPTLEQSVRSPPITDRMIASIGSPSSWRSSFGQRQTAFSLARSPVVGPGPAPSHEHHSRAGKVAIDRLPTTPSSRASSSTGSHTCNQCGKECKRATDLKRHQGTIHGNFRKFYVCNYPRCLSRNRREDKMKEHCQKKHDQERGREDYREIRD